MDEFEELDAPLDTVFIDENTANAGPSDQLQALENAQLYSFPDLA
jgi:hypothetical protein